MWYVKGADYADADLSVYRFISQVWQLLAGDTGQNKIFVMT